MVWWAMARWVLAGLRTSCSSTGVILTCSTSPGHLNPAETQHCPPGSRLPLLVPLAPAWPQKPFHGCSWTASEDGISASIVFVISSQLRLNRKMEEMTRGEGRGEGAPGSQQIRAQLKWLWSSNLMFLHTLSFGFYFSLLIPKSSGLTCLLLPLSHTFPFFHSFHYSPPTIFSPVAYHFHLLDHLLGVCRVTYLRAYNGVSQWNPVW